MRLLSRLVLIALIALSVSCDAVTSSSDSNSEGEENNEEEQEETTEEFEYSTQEQVEQDITDIYNVLRHSSYYGLNFMAMSALSSDIVESTAEGSSDEISSLNRFDTYEVQPSSPVLETYWNQSYRAIQKADTLINFLPESDFDQSFKDNSLGKAFFLKALVLHDLVRSFGGIPIEWHEENPERASREEAYNRIMEMSQEAVGLLPDFTEPTTPSRQAARMLMVRALYYQQNWNDAAGFTEDFLAESNFNLAESYSSLFENPENPETIFALKLQSDRLPSWHQPSSEGGEQHLALHHDYADSVNSRSEDARNKLINSYKSGDQQVYYTSKFSRSGNTAFLPLLRISEAHLIFAESVARLGGREPAVEHLNLIRTRAGLDSVSPTDFSSDESLVKAVRWERSIEFFAEGQRWFTVKQSDRATDILQNLSYYNNRSSSFEEHNRLFPIPQSALEENSNLTQNPGY